MKKNTIFLSRNSVIYKEVTYDLDYFLKNLLNKKKRNICIIGEEIFIKVYSVSNKEELKKDNINLIIKKNFGSSDDYLIDYEISKDRKNIYIYAVRGGIYIEKFCTAPIRVNIIPIQISTAKLCNKIISRENYVVIFEYNNLFYYINISNGYLVESLIRNNLEEIQDVLKNISENIYVDTSINHQIKGNRININERRAYNEEVC